MMRHLPILLCALSLTACQSMYYNMQEKMGNPKREIMVDRVKAARDSQKEAKEGFANALEEFRSVINSKGSPLEEKYKTLNEELQRSEHRATAVHQRIASVENVSVALFKEWRKEIGQYSSDNLKKASQKKYDATFARYKELMHAMKAAESKMEPVLKPLRDQVLFLKHNLNAEAIASLGDELLSVQDNVDSLIRDMEKSISQADKFIDSMKEE